MLITELDVDVVIAFLGGNVVDRAGAVLVVVAGDLSFGGPLDSDALK